MAKIQKLKDDQEVDIYPVTHERAVFDSNNVKLESKISRMDVIDGATENGALYRPVVVDPDDYTKASYYITSSGKWNTAVAYKHMMLDVTKVKYMKITANQGHDAPGWFVTKFGIGYSGQQANVVENGYFKAKSGETIYVRVPEGAVGAAITYGQTDETYGWTYKPAEIVLYFAQTDELSDDVVQDEYIELPYYYVDKTRISTSVTAPGSTSVYSLVFPVSAGDLLMADFTWTGGACNFGLIDTPPVLGRSTYSNTQRQESQAAHYTYTSPIDGYFFICTWESATVLTSFSAKILNRKYKQTELTPSQLQKSVFDLNNYASPFTEVNLSALTTRTYMLGTDGCMHEETARHVIVPVQPYGRIFVKKNESRTYAHIAWLTSDASVVAPLPANLVSGTYRITDRSEDGNSYTVPEGASYCYVLTLYASNDYTPEVLSYSPPIGEADPTPVPEPDDEPLVFQNNPKHIYEPLLLAATRNHYYEGFFTPSTTTLLWFTDVHGDSIATKNVLLWKNKYATYIDDVIATGDQAQTHFYQSFNWWNTAGAGNILQVIGNHDAWANESQFNGTSYPGLTFQDMIEQQYGSTSFYVIKPTYVYNKYFAPYVANWNVIQPSDAAESGKCYYYKDYSAIRLIVLDMMHCARGEDWDGASRSSSVQLNWFADVLEDARQNNKPVVVATHMSPAFAIDMKYIPCPYNTTTFDGTTTTSDSTKFAYHYVNDFIAAGGEFVCWIVGHSHNDKIYTIQNGTANEQFVVCLTCASARNPSSIARGSAGIRVVGTKTEDAFQTITFDTARKLIKIVRVGQSINDMMKRYEQLTYRYANSTDDYNNTLPKGLVSCD